MPSKTQAVRRQIASLVLLLGLLHQTHSEVDQVGSDQPIDMSEQVAEERNVIADIVRDVLAEQSRSGNVDPARQREIIENYWSKNAATTLAMRELGFWQRFADVNIPMVLFALAVFCIFFSFAITVPTVLYNLMCQFNISERFARTVRYWVFVGLLGAGIVAALAIVEFDWWNQLLGLGFLGIIVSVGFSSQISNAVSGFLMPMDPLIAVGRELENEGIRGIVVELNLRQIVLMRTAENGAVLANADGEAVYTTIPNHKFGDSATTFYKFHKRDAVLKRYAADEADRVEHVDAKWSLDGQLKRNA